MTDEEEGDDVEAAAEVGVTDSADVRWTHLSSLVTLSVVVGYMLIVGVQLLAPAFGVPVGTVEPGTWAAFSAAFTMGMVYSVGVDTYKAFMEMRGP